MELIRLLLSPTFSCKPSWSCRWASRTLDHVRAFGEAPCRKGRWVAAEKHEHLGNSTLSTWKLASYLVVGADVDQNRQAPVRVQSGQSDVQRQLSDGYSYAVRSQISESQNSLAVRHYDSLNFQEYLRKTRDLLKHIEPTHLDITRRPVGEDLIDLADWVVIDSYIQSP